MIDLEELRRRLGACHPRGDSDGAWSRAAVVVPLRQRPEGMELLFELRPLHLSRSPGEVSFPGGRVEPGEGLVEAALRELEEELGVPASRVEVLGDLSTRQRRRGEFVHPFVCLLDPAAQIRLQAAEVEELFAVPLAALLSLPFGEARIVEEFSLSEDFPTQYLPGGAWRRREERPVHFFRYGGFFVWGLTAAIVRELLALLAPGGEPQGRRIFGENP